MEINIGILKEQFWDNVEAIWKDEAVLAVHISGYDIYGQYRSCRSFVTKGEIKKWLEGGFDPSQ
jgi:hypothetical protein